MKLVTTRLGGLVARIVDVDQTAPPELVCVLCHGFGAPGTDLVSLAAECFALRPGLSGRVRFVFPEAPLALEGLPFGGRAWWQIDMARLERMMRTGDLGAFLDDVPEGLPEARRLMIAALDDLSRAFGVPMSRIVLGGFSQGAMLATDVTLRLEEAPAALCVMSGALINRTEWQARAHQRAGLLVLQSHGTQDPILPFVIGEALRDVLVEAGLRVTFLPFSGGHGIHEGVLEALAALLEERLSPVA